MVRTTASLLALLALLALPAATAAAQQAGPARDAAGETEILGRLNAMRNAEGLAPLARHEGLDAAALTHSTDMAWHQMLAHVSPRTGDPAARVQATGLEPAAIAENVALAASAVAAHQSLVASDAHRGNMMSPRFTHVGIAVVPSERGVYVTEVFAQLGEAPGPEADGGGEAALPEEPAAPGTVAPWSSEPGLPADAPPAPAPGGTVEDAPLPPGLEGAAPAMRAPAASGERRVAGYWVFANGRWYYYPLPPDAQPGQVLTPSREAPGQPPPQVAGPGSGLRVYQARPGRRVYAAPPPPPFGWSPRREHRRWYYSH